MRAKQPVDSGYVERDGVRLFYEIFGDSPQTMVFIPAWSIGHSRVFKAMIPYFSETYRCITFDPRGNGKSDRPEQVESYSLDTYVADVLAVMDATRAGPAILVGLSFSGMLSAVIAAYHPERVKAAILTGTAASVGPGYQYMVPQQFLNPKPDTEGWNTYDKAFWHTNYPAFADFFLRQIFVEPHSTKQIEDGCEWAAETTGQTLAKTVEARMLPPPFDVSEAMFRKIKCPVLMIHGDNDRIQPLARAKLDFPGKSGGLF
jgi:pimeloyl-ACP methyl ester carboxylesterase